MGWGGGREGGRIGYSDRGSLPGHRHHWRAANSPKRACSHYKSPSGPVTDVGRCIYPASSSL